MSDIFRAVSESTLARLGSTSSLFKARACFPGPATRLVVVAAMVAAAAIFLVVHLFNMAGPLLAIRSDQVLRPPNMSAW